MIRSCFIQRNIHHKYIVLMFKSLNSMSWDAPVRCYIEGLCRCNTLAFLDLIFSVWHWLRWSLRFVFIQCLHFNTLKYCLQLCLHTYTYRKLFVWGRMVVITKVSDVHPCRTKGRTGKNKWWKEINCMKMLKMSLIMDEEEKENCWNRDLTQTLTRRESSSWIRSQILQYMFKGLKYLRN